jgi:predicted DNA-binding protein
MTKHYIVIERLENMNKVQICARIDADLLDRLDMVRNRIPRSTMLNEVLEKGLNQMEDIKVA